MAGDVEPSPPVAGAVAGRAGQLTVVSTQLTFLTLSPLLNGCLHGVYKRQYFTWIKCKRR